MRRIATGIVEMHPPHGDAADERIALACSFTRHSHLSAAFKRDTGITPRQFREGLRIPAIY